MTRVSVSLPSQSIVVLTHIPFLSLFLQVVIHSRLDQSMEEARELKVNCVISNFLSICSSIVRTTFTHKRVLFCCFALEGIVAL